MKIKKIRTAFAALVFVFVLTGAVAPVAFAQSVTQLQHPLSNEQVTYLIRSTLLTLNDADRSGNYTVLRDLASPTFQAANTDADIASAFSDLRRRRIDLSVVAVVAPHLTAEPAVDALGLLELSGYFPANRLQIDFNLKFQNVSGKWRLVAISVSTPKAHPVNGGASTNGRRP